MLGEGGWVAEMKALLYSFSLIVVNLYAFSAEEWLYYKHYPWVYDNATEGWLYLRGAGDGKVYMRTEQALRNGQSSKNLSLLGMRSMRNG